MACSVLCSALLLDECVCLCWGAPSPCGEFSPRPCGVPWQRQLGTQWLLSLLCPILALCTESGAAHGLELFARPAFGPQCWSRLPPRLTVAGVRGAMDAVDSFLSGELSLRGCVRKGRDRASPLPLWVPGPWAILPVVRWAGLSADTCQTLSVPRFSWNTASRSRFRRPCTLLAPTLRSAFRLDCFPPFSVPLETAPFLLAQERVCV